MPNSTSTNGNLTIIDMVGRTVTIPMNIQRVVATSPPMTTMVYMLAPEKLVGLNFAWNNEEIEYVPNEYRNLPVVGGWFGRQDGNYEEIISVFPDIVIEGAMGNVDLNSVNLRQEKFGSIPVIGATDNSDLTKMAPTIEFIGKLLDSEDKSNKLVDFLNKYLNKANDVSNSIPDSEKKRVYYAEGPEGLQTDPKGSLHAQLIDIVGGNNIADVPLEEGVGQVEVSIEQVMAWNPEVIITTDSNFYKKVYSDSKWANIDAVKNKQVYLSPTSPFKWFDRPPGANMIIGIPWTAKVIYPDKYSDINLKEVVKEFYRDFYHYDLTDEEVTAILKNSGLKEENM
ncbi:MAG: iron ABC transporter substrate-binding protein [Methanobrevibacter sp.]|nr:iron ABC transporter substrate-binding protein [Methanobrevibacter sp.]